MAQQGEQPAKVFVEGLKNQESIISTFARVKANPQPKKIPFQVNVIPKPPPTRENVVGAPRKVVHRSRRPRPKP